MLNQTIGAWEENGGHTFRVWAPNADDVRVLLQTGALWDSNRSSRVVPLTRDNSGYWRTSVAGVSPGTLYRYDIAFQGVTQQKLDPAARDVIHSGLTRHMPHNQNASIVPHPNETVPVPFRTPGFEDFLIYQFHVGSFAGRNDGLTDDPIAGFGDAAQKLGYIRELGFSAIQPLPVQEFSADRSWGYNPGAYFAPESAYGSPRDLRAFVDMAHAADLAVLFDLVWNHAGPQDNVLWVYDGSEPLGQGGIYFDGGKITPWGRGPAWWKQEVKDFFFENACMYFDDFRADGLRLDATRYIDGNDLAVVIGRLRDRYPDKYIVAEHLPADPWITTTGNFSATWFARSHHECQRALSGDRPVHRVKSFLGWDGFDASWNLVKYTLGSHDDCGDQENGDAEEGLHDWDRRHRYLIDQFGGRDDWLARAKCRAAWALNVAMPGNPLLFMGSECHMGAPSVAWGYWHDGKDRRGDHRFDWAVAGDGPGMEMRRLVTAANQTRRQNPALRSDDMIICHEDHHNGVLAFKRWRDGNLVLSVVNLGDGDFGNHSYGVDTGGQQGRWTQILCTQDAAFGGWDGAGNAFYEPDTRADGRIQLNLPQWSVLMFRLL